jgi:hypothetical protein
MGPGEFYGQTTVHPVGLAMVLIMAALTFALPKKTAIVPMLIIACMIPSAQRIVVGGMDFNFTRIIALAGILRLLIRQEYTGLRWLPLDGVIVAWGVVGVVAQTMLWGDPAATITRIGYTAETLGMYFFARVMLRDWESVRFLCKWLGIMALIVGPFFLVEWLTRRNIFAVFGGVLPVTMMRDGRMRCMGAFSHPILAGVFWATVLPLVAARWWDPKANRYIVVAACGACLWIVVASGSSTPVGALAAVFLGAVMYFARRYMGWIQVGVVCMLILLHFVMKGPVWSLLAKTNVVGGSTGWHRYYLVDRAIANFGEWALWGTQGTSHWGIGLWDVTNQYVIEGVRGGLLLMMLFGATVYLAFVYVGRAWRSVEASTPKRMMCWCIGVSIFAHAAAFLGVSYFGQIIMLWYLTLAAAGALGEMALKEPSAQRAKRRSRLASPTAASRASRAGYRERLSARIASVDSSPGAGNPNS